MFVVLMLALFLQNPEIRKVEENVIVTATADPVAFHNLARSVQVLKREQIERLPVRSVTELIGYASSVETRSRGPMGIQADFSARGAGFGQVLVLVNGIRINNTQSGHHNADFPVLLEDVERVEILNGPGSSLYGADALGGTINIITRQPASRAQVEISGGQHGFFSASANAGFTAGAVGQAFSVSGTRSSGFTYDRDFRTLGVTSQTTYKGSSLLVSHIDRDFGANGFYGPAPSREWTGNSMVALDQQILARGPWRVAGQTYYQTHNDRFLYDLRTPGLAENAHRTHSTGGQMKVSRALPDESRITAGLDVGGDWIRSNNLGRHSFSRVSVFAELQQKVGEVLLYPGIRHDRYSDFGKSTSPSISATWWATPQVKARAAAGRAFRVPTFTERYYRDPNHQANANLTPETAWGVEAGVDYLIPEGWVASLTLFSRKERDVIDWVRDVPTVRWQTTNIRTVNTTGVETGIRGAVAAGANLEFQYTYINADAIALTQLSKYVLDFARHSFTSIGDVALPGNFGLSQKLNMKRRADGRQYWIWDARVSKTFSEVTLWLDGTNLLNTAYQEIRGVDMPGRWFITGVTFRR